MEERLTLPPEHDGQAWLYRCDHARRLPHHHAELEFNLVTRGRGVYLLGERRYDLRAGMLVWLFPQQDHVLLDESADFACWIGVFTPALLRRVCTTTPTQFLLDADPPGQFCRALADAQAARLDRLLEEVTAAQGDTARCNAGLGYALLTAWAAWGEAGDAAPVGMGVHPAVERAVRLLRDDPDAAGLEETARQVGLSASRLSRLFKTQIGVSLLDFRDGQRMERFFRLYGDGGDVTLLEAALEAGWGSYPQFHRVFTRRMGIGPAEFRRRRGQEAFLP